MSTTMITVPRLPLPGTLEIPRHHDFVRTGTYTWGPIIVNLLEPKLEDMSSEFSGYSKAQRSRLACLRCRIKKTKCDGNIPCNHCIKSVHDCSYEERRKPELSEKALTEKLAMLQSRYDALTPTTSGNSGSVDSPSSNSSSNLPHTPWSPGRLPRIEANVTDDVRDALLKIALIYLPRCNFDIDGPSIFEGLKLPPPQQPHPAFINALMLLGSYYAATTPSQRLPANCPPAEYFVQEIRAHMANALSDVDRLMHYIAASIMLSWWLLQTGRFLEGQYEVCSTARLAIDCGLHQIDEQTVKSVLYPGSVAAPARQVSSILGPPSSIADLEMRVGVFWGIYLGDKNAALMTGLPAAFDERTANPELQITTVFPKRTGHFDDPWTSGDFCSIDDLMGFPQVPSATPKIFKSVTTPQTVIGASAQAMTLLLRGIRLACVTPRSLQEAKDLRNALITLNQAMSRFTSQLPRATTIGAIQSMPPPYAFGATYAPLAYFSLAEVRSAAYVVIIRMHQAAEQLQNFQGGEQGLGAGLGMGEDKKMAAAHATTAIAEEIFTELNKPDCDLSAKDGLCVIIGYLWTHVAVVYVERIAKLRQSLPRGASNPELQLCSNNLGKIMSAIKRLAQVFPVLDLQVEKVEEMIKETAGSP